MDLFALSFWRRPESSRHCETRVSDLSPRRRPGSIFSCRAGLSSLRDLPFVSMGDPWVCPGFPAVLTQPHPERSRGARFSSVGQSCRSKPLVRRTAEGRFRQSSQVRPPLLPATTSPRAESKHESSFFDWVAVSNLVWGGEQNEPPTAQGDVHWCSEYGYKRAKRQKVIYHLGAGSSPA